ncbi:hypothetical protein T484DRAFT_1617116 [Baffinella frigidus]|nr:hypothetical protein T484DRAFT_1617116 [Cryptophyta sp. CCMP2293]
MLCYVMLCYVMLCYVMLCYVMLCYVMLCYECCPSDDYLQTTCPSGLLKVVWGGWGRKQGA